MMWNYIANQVSSVLAKNDSRSAKQDSACTCGLLETYKYDIVKLQSKLKILEVSNKQAIQMNDELISELNLYKSKIDEKRVLELSKKNFISINEIETNQTVESVIVKPDMKFISEVKKNRTTLFPISQRAQTYKNFLMKKHFDYCDQYQPWQKQIFKKYETYLFSLSKKELVLSYVAAAVLLDDTHFVLDNLIEEIITPQKLECTISSSATDLKLANIKLHKENKSKTLKLDRAYNEIKNLKKELKQYKNDPIHLRTKSNFK